MNSIEQLKRNIDRAVEGIETSLRKPKKPSGRWWLDAKYVGNEVTIEWAPDRGFGVSTREDDTAYGEGADETFGDVDSATRRVIELLREGSRSIPPKAVLLRELRANVGYTQEQLAERLGVQQAAISRLERRSDMTLSSLRRYVEALGAELEISVRTRAGEQVLLMDSPKKAKRLACEHVVAEKALSDSGDNWSCIATLSRMFCSLASAAGDRWPMTSLSPFLLEDSNVPLALAIVEQGSVSLNTDAVSRLVARCASLAALPAERDKAAMLRYVLAHEIGHFVSVEPFERRATASERDAELRADSIAGWLAALAGDDAAPGAFIASFLGCTTEHCAHPTPEQRELAFLAGHSRGARDLLKPRNRMSLLVMTVRDLERTRDFYAALGLELTPEQHGRGPRHYSCLMEQTLVELYPCKADQSLAAPLRIGFSVAKAAWKRFQSAGYLTDEPRLLRSQNGASVFLIRDPDRNAIELEVAPT